MEDNSIISEQKGYPVSNVPEKNENPAPTEDHWFSFHYKL